MWQKLDRMRQQWQLCDVSLVTVDNRMFMAHSPVLAASSNTLHDILIRQNQTGTGEETQKKVFLKTVTSDVLEVTLNFIYGITPLSRLAFERLQVGAKELGIMGAYEYCCHQLEKLSVETSGSKGEGKSFPAAMRHGSQEENLISYQWQMDEPPGAADCQKCEFPLAVSQSIYQVSHTELGLDAAQGVNSIVCWPLNEHEPGTDGKASGSPGVDKVTDSVSSTASDADNSQPSILNGMPSDDIHTAMFTQMSLVDLTAGVKCPHIKGIIGEDNPMDSFLVENELVDETFKTSLQADESDFDETPTLEHSIDFAVPVPLKKRKRSSVRISDDDRVAESSGQSCIQIKSSEDQNLDKNSDFQNFLERNTSVSFKDSSSDNCNLNLLSCFVSSNSLNPCSSTRPIQAALQRNFTKTVTLISLDEGPVIEPQNVPTNDFECVQSVCDSEKLQRENQSMHFDSLSGYRSSFHSCISSTSQCCQKQNVQTDSILDVPRDDLHLSHSSFNIKNNMLPPGTVSDLSDNLLVSHSPNSSRSFLSINKSRASSGSSLQSVGWQDGFASIKPCFTASSNVLNTAKKLNWESMSMLEPICSRASKLNQELASDLEPTGDLDVTVSCEQKVFTSLDNSFPKYGTNRLQCAVSSKDVDSALSMHKRQILCFSTLGPCQGIAPNTMTRNQPIEICPPVGDVSVLASTFQSSDETFPKESLLAVATNHIQESYVSSSPEPEDSSDQLRNGKCQCDLCDKVFKNIR